jgi:Flp pilus assembly pilin Flp
MSRFRVALAAHTGLRDERGASAVEYGLLAVAIAALIVIIAFSLGGVVTDLFGQSCDNIKSKVTVSTTCDRS